MTAHAQPHRRRWRTLPRVAALMLIGLLLVLPDRPAAAQRREAPPTAGAAGVRPRDAVDPAELQSFVDRAFGAAMARDHVPGAAIVVVENGLIALLKGYGVADVARQTPVDPQHTVFRVASISKVFTATAVMQLAEQGRLRLDDDVNRYLTRFKVPKTYPAPVTLGELLTHTAGFDAPAMGQETDNPAGLRPLGAFLAERLPPRILPPGQFYSYSNWNTALAGYIVEAVSGVPFDRYLQQQILAPLGMDQSSFLQPVPAPLAAQLATGYDPFQPTPRPAPPRYFDTAPAAGLSTTVADMAQFMLAQLGDGSNARGRILGPDALRELQALHFRASDDADFNGAAYGFARYRRNGELILSKDGALPGFGSYLALFPERRLGFFIAANTDDSGWMSDFERQFVNRFYPVPAPPRPTTPEALRGSTGRFAGTYWSNTYARTTLEKLRQLTRQVQMTDEGNGQLAIHFWDGGTVQLTHTTPLGFENVYDGVAYRWGFLQDSHGRTTEFVAGNSVYDRISWYETTGVQEALAAGFLLVFLYGCLVWLVAPVVRRRPPGNPISRRSPADAARVAAALLCLLNLVFLVAIVLLLRSATASQNVGYSWIDVGVPHVIYLLLCIPLVTAALAVALPILGFFGWQDRSWSLAGRFLYVLVGLVALGFIPFLSFWNLIGFHVYAH